MLAHKIVNRCEDGIASPKSLLRCLVLPSLYHVVENRLDQLAVPFDVNFPATDCNSARGPALPICTAHIHSPGTVDPVDQLSVEGLVSSPKQHNDMHRLHRLVRNAAGLVRRERVKVC